MPSNREVRCFLLWEPFGRKVELASLVLDVAVENDYKKVAPLAKAIHYLASKSV